MVTHRHPTFFPYTRDGVDTENHLESGAGAQVVSTFCILSDLIGKLRSAVKVKGRLTFLFLSVNMRKDKGERL